jgi:hypothetical protein
MLSIVASRYYEDTVCRFLARQMIHSYKNISAFFGGGTSAYYGWASLNKKPRLRPRGGSGLSLSLLFHVFSKVWDRVQLKPNFFSESFKPAKALAWSMKPEPDQNPQKSGPTRTHENLVCLSSSKYFSVTRLTSKWIGSGKSFISVFLKFFRTKTFRNFLQIFWLIYMWQKCWEFLGSFLRKFIIFEKKKTCK